MEIKTASKGDIEGIMEIERASFSVPWSENSMMFEINSEDSYVGVAEENGEILGFAILHRFGDESEIFNIAVKEAHRGKGIGKMLMLSVIDSAEKNAVDLIYLEVRESNTAAFGLYEGLGFETLAIRKNYYDAPKENAIIMVLDLKRGNRNDNNVG